MGWAPQKKPSDTPWPIWYESKPGANAFVEGAGIIYNMVLAILLFIGMLAFWFFLLVIMAACIQLFIAIFVGLMNPVPFVYR